jgi:glutamate dehydrogenase
MTAPPAAEQPTSGPVTVIRTHVSERPFIVTTIREYLYGRDIEVERFLHPVLHVERSGSGAIVAVGPASEGAPLESIVHCEVRRIEDGEELEEMRAGICRHLEDAVAVTNDFECMTSALDDAIDALDEVTDRLEDRAAEIDEVRAFLEWLRPNFVFLGYDEWGSLDGPAGGLMQAGATPELGLPRRAGRNGCWW